MYAKLAVFTVLVAAVMAGSLRNDDSFGDDDKGFHLFCSPCKDVFKGIKAALPQGVPITKEILKVALDICCDRIPVVNGLCKEGCELGLDELFKYITENENIDPEHICKVIKLC